MSGYVVRLSIPFVIGKNLTFLPFDWIDTATIVD
jgi:hypothetical protein